MTSATVLWDIPRASIFEKLCKARSPLYRCRAQWSNSHWKALADIYTTRSVYLIHWFQIANFQKLILSKFNQLLLSLSTKGVLYFPKLITLLQQIKREHLILSRWNLSEFQKKYQWNQAILHNVWLLTKFDGLRMGGGPSSFRRTRDFYILRVGSLWEVALIVVRDFRFTTGLLTRRGWLSLLFFFYAHRTKYLTRKREKVGPFECNILEKAISRKSETLSFYGTYPTRDAKIEKKTKSTVQKAIEKPKWTANRSPVILCRQVLQSRNPTIRWVSLWRVRSRLYEGESPRIISPKSTAQWDLAVATFQKSPREILASK